MTNRDSEVRKLKQALLGTAIVAILALAAGIYQLVRSPDQYLSVREIVVKDGSGVARVRLRAPAGNGNLAFYDENSKPVIVLEQGRVRAGVLERGGLRFVDEEGRAYVNLVADEHYPSLLLSSSVDDGGNVDLGPTPTGPSLNMIGPKSGNSIASLEAGKDGTRLLMKSGRRRVELAAWMSISAQLTLAGAFAEGQTPASTRRKNTGKEDTITLSAVGEDLSNIWVNLKPVFAPVKGEDE